MWACLCETKWSCTFPCKLSALIDRMVHANKGILRPYLLNTSHTISISWRTHVIRLHMLLNKKDASLSSNSKVDSKYQVLAQVPILVQESIHYICGHNYYLIGKTIAKRYEYFIKQKQNSVIKFISLYTTSSYTVNVETPQAKHRIYW